MSQPYVNEKPIKTYRQLKEALSHFSNEQLDSDITVHNGADDEMLPAELRIINGEKENRLDDNHPVIFAP
jgi:hypothetical protein